ncbi:MAG TPA: phage holin family protein [Acidothermaceae bacterium]|jgi:hypothetical protein
MSAPTQDHERTIPTTPLNQRSLGELVATLSRDLALLVHQELELAKTELKTGLIKGAAAAGGLITAVVFLLLAAPIVSIAAALGIHALGVTLGWSFLIVAGVYLLGALLAASFGVMALRRVSKHKRAVDSVKADLHAIARKPRPARPIET